jgi:RyR domain-containing protein
MVVTQYSAGVASITAPEHRGTRRILRWVSFVVLVLGLIGAGIGLAGLREEGSDWLDLALAELQLVTGTWQPTGDGRLPWTLNVALLIVPLAATAFGFLLLVDFFSWLRSLSRGHTVLVGDSAAASIMQVRLRRPNASSRRRVLVAKKGDRDSLWDSGVRRARAIVVCGDDSFDSATNIATTRTATDLARRDDFTAHLLVGDPALALALRARRLAQPANEDRRIRVFTVDDLAARHQVRLVPLDGVESPHLLVVGAGPFGRAVIVEFARHWLGTANSSGTPLVTLVAPDAERAVAELLERWPFLATTCDLRPMELPPEQAMLSIARRPYRSYFCDDDEERAMGTALTAASRWRPGPGSVVVRLTRLAPRASVGPALFDDLGGALDLVSVYDAAAQEILRDEEPLVAFARGIHQSYVDDALRRGEQLGSRPLLVSWQDLSKDAKESNLQQATAFVRTLAAIHCSVAPRSRLADPFFFRPGEVEELARREHEHWQAERKESGWTYGQQRNDRRKVHPLLVPWERLSESDRSRNRAIVRARPLLFDRVLEREGLQIVRLAADAAQEHPAPTIPAWLTPELVERLARTVHQRYLDERLANGIELGSRPAMRPWEELTEDTRETNRAQVRDIGAKLDLLEATVTATPPVRPFVFAEDEVEMLARYEHDRWVSERIAAGWTYGPERDDEAKVHHLLVPWLYLNQRQQDVDKQVVLAVPGLIEAAGWYISRR